MRTPLLLVATLLVTPAFAVPVLFDFDSAPLHAPLPLDLTVDGVTAHLTGTGQGFSIQEANVLGFTPAGFAGHIVYPNSVFLADLKVSFSVPLDGFSILYAPEEYGTDSSATMRVTAYLAATEVGTSTFSIDPPGTWPTGTLAISTATPFDNVVVHYDKAPVTGGDYGPIFMADNMEVSVAAAAAVPDPLNTAAALALALACLFGAHGRSRASCAGHHRLGS